MNYSLGIDIGTGAAKGVLFAEHVTPICQATSTYATAFPHPSWAQQNPKDWWNAVVTVTREIIAKSKVRAEDIKVVSISCQAPTVLMLDEKGEPTYDAIIWMDRRSESQCEWLANKVGKERIFEITGTILDPYYVYPELLWLKEKEPEAFRRSKKLLQVNGYINYMLTGEYSLDVVHASHTQMYDVEKRCWSQELFDAIGVSTDIFPPVTECTDKIGEVSEAAAAITGLAAGTAVLSGTVDGAAAVLEAGVTGGGRAVEMTGTSSGLMISFDEMKTARNMAHQYSIIPGGHILYGAMSSTGASYKWFRDQLYSNGVKNEDAYREMDAEVMQYAKEPTNLIFLPYMQGERSPIWDTNAKGTIVGLSLSTTRAQMIRAILEGVGFALRDNVEEAKHVGVHIGSLCSVGGCSNSDIWTKIKASILNMSISVPKVTLGAPGGLGVMMSYYIGEFSTLREAAEQCMSTVRVIQPEPEWIEYYDKMYAIYHDLYASIKPQFDELACL